MNTLGNFKIFNSEMLSWAKFLRMLKIRNASLAVVFLVPVNRKQSTVSNKTIGMKTVLSAELEVLECVHQISSVLWG